MISKEIIKEIINYGVMAPSGENCQPWTFTVGSDTIYVFNKPEIDNSLYGWGKRATYLSLGALLENMIIASQNYGLNYKLELFPDPKNDNLVFKLILFPGNFEKNPLLNSIKQRTTNRKKFYNKPLTQLQSTELNSIKPIGKAKFKLIEDPVKIKEIGTIGGINEKILFTNKLLHTFFFNHINWTKQEDEQKSFGFFIDTLELPPPAKLLFKPVIKNWKILKFLNKFGFSTMVSKENGKMYGQSPAVGAVIISDNSKESFFDAGRVMQQAWLTLTKNNLYAQPLTGVIFLKLKILAKETEHLTAKHVNLINRSYSTLEKIFQTNPNESIAMMLRIGESSPPSAKSTRLPAVINFQ